MNDDEPEPAWYFENRQRSVRFDENAVRTFVAQIAQDHASEGGFAVVVSSDDALRRANRQFRNVSAATDVLSFPDGEDGYLGDILISARRALEQAAEHGHSIEQEINILVLHGVLHLNGYDHEIDDGAMQREEERLRQHYGLASSLIVRSTS